MSYDLKFPAFQALRSKISGGTDIRRVKGAGELEEHYPRA